MPSGSQPPPGFGSGPPGPDWSTANPSDQAATPQRDRTVGDVVGALSLAHGLALLGAFLIIVGSLGPWVDTFLGSVSGIRGDGRISAVAGLVVVVLVIVMAAGKGGGTSSVLAVLAALAAGAVGVYDLLQINDSTQDATLFGRRVATAGWGLYVVILGAAVALAGLFAAKRGPR